MPFRVDRPDCDSSYPLPLSRHPTDGSDLSFRPRCLPRKRRHIQTPYLSIPSQQQPSLLSPNAYASPQDPYSPPVSPKTVVPRSCSSASPSVLRPCHICHRRPTTRHVLDAYADCDLCGERACFICLRQCDSFACAGPANAALNADEDLDLASSPEAFHGNTDPRRKICSSCAIEGITETDTEIVRCFDCVREHSTPWSAGSMASGWTMDGVDPDSMRE